MPEENQNVEEFHASEEIHTTNESNQSHNETQVQNEQKNTVATVGMWFSIIWVIAVITIFLARLWFPMLFIWFILWIVGLFYKPRGKARVAVCIPLAVFVAIASVICYIWSSIKTPANEFIDWAKPQLEQLESEDFDEDRFENILQAELNKITNETSEEERKNMFESSEGSNFLEKGSYLFFSIARQSIETAIEKYNNGELPEIDEEENNIIDVDIEVEDDDEDETQENDDDKENDTKNEKVEIFTKSEQDDIEQILNILE